MRSAFKAALLAGGIALLAACGSETGAGAPDCAAHQAMRIVAAKASAQSSTCGVT
jgi:hypothetical protein